MIWAPVPWRRRTCHGVVQSAIDVSNTLLVYNVPFVHIWPGLVNIRLFNIVQYLVYDLTVQQTDRQTDIQTDKHTMATDPLKPDD